MFEQLEWEPPEFCWVEFSDDEFDSWLTANPQLRRHFDLDPDAVDPVLDPATEAWLLDQPPADYEPSHREQAVPLFQRDLDSLTDAEATRRLIEIEEGIAECHATRARLVALLAANRPASADRTTGTPGARATGTGPPGAAANAEADVAPEVLEVSEWLAHELQMAHPYSLSAAGSDRDEPGPDRPSHRHSGSDACGPD